MRSFIFCAALFVAACSPKFKIQSDTPFPGDFEKYATFKFYNPDNMPASNFSFEEADKKVIFDAVADEMISRGYKSQQDADLMIKIQGGTKSTIEIQNDQRFYPNNYNYYDRYGRYDPYNDRPRDQSEKESSIIIDVIDIEREKIVWQGVGIGSFGKKEALTEIQIREGIAQIFATYTWLAGNN